MRLIWTVIPGRQRARAKRGPMTGSANPESRNSPMRNSASEVRVALWNDGEHAFAFSRLMAPELVRNSTLGINRGRRECRATDAPMAPCAIKSTGVGTTGTPDQPGIPCAMALRLIRALLGDHRLVATVAGETREHHRRLGACFGAPEPHDFAVRQPHHRRGASAPDAAHVHRIPPSTSVTTAKRPSCGDGTKSKYS